MKPIRKVSTVKSTFPTFIDRETLTDLLHIHWSSMRLIGDEDEVSIDFGLPQLVPVIIQVKKGKDSRSRYRILNGEKESI